ncbi:hypothetical protein ACO0LM_10455 [Undibacterium sp. Di26W]|uniref:hypothetical protein n=1 Tax=Undibacterium sp. Di26W TaxID=3413035 RepID=UPI003BF141A3
MIDLELEKRLMNWRDTVRGGIGGGGSACCAAWAAAYVAARNKEEEAIEISLEINEPQSALRRIDINELDGWLVEAAVRANLHYDQRMVLRLKYVMEFPNHFIKNKLRVQNLRINDTSIRLIHGRAIDNLKKVLEKLETPAKIRSYNSHARYVPRPDATVVPSGATAPEENAKP